MLAESRMVLMFFLFFLHVKQTFTQSRGLKCTVPPSALKTPFCSTFVPQRLATWGRHLILSHSRANTQVCEACAGAPVILLTSKHLIEVPEETIAAFVRLEFDSRLKTDSQCVLHWRAEPEHQDELSQYL